MNAEAGPVQNPTRYTDRDTGSSRAERVYADLKRELLQGAFPLGERLAEERLGARMGVSRTPVREALSRLHAEGLVRRSTRGGYTPAVPDLDVIHELYEVRRGIELLALHRPTHSGEPHDPMVLSGLVEDWSALADDPQAAAAGAEFVLLDEDFHVQLSQASGNRPAAELLGLINSRIRVVRMHDFLTPERVEVTIAEHLGIAHAVGDGDLDRAGALLEAHLVHSMTVVEERAAAAIARMVARTALGEDA